MTNLKQEILKKLQAELDNENYNFYADEISSCVEFESQVSLYFKGITIFFRKITWFNGCKKTVNLGDRATIHINSFLDATIIVA